MKATLRKNCSKIVVVAPILFFSLLVIYHSAFTNSDFSSFIDTAKYNPLTRTLIISIDEERYMYCGIPIMHWFNYVRASSKGEFYNSYLKDKFTCKMQAKELRQIIDGTKEYNLNKVFDHKMPLCLGGNDYGTKAKLPKLSIYNQGDYLEKVCDIDMKQKEHLILKDFGFDEKNDGSWENKDGELIECDIETNLEEYLTSNYYSCTH